MHEFTICERNNIQIIDFLIHVSHFLCTRCKSSSSTKAQLVHKTHAEQRNDKMRTFRSHKQKIKSHPQTTHQRRQTISRAACCSCVCVCVSSFPLSFSKFHIVTRFSWLANPVRVGSSTFAHIAIWFVGKVSHTMFIYGVASYRDCQNYVKIFSIQNLTRCCRRSGAVFVVGFDVCRVV